MFHQKRLSRNFLNRPSITKHLYCPICHDILDNPMRSYCGHTYCGACIEIHIRRKRECPVCHLRIRSGSTLSKDIIPSKMVFDLEVECVIDGCKWRGKNGTYRAHYVQCKFRDKKVSDFSKYKVIEIEQEKAETGE